MLGYSAQKLSKCCLFSGSVSSLQSLGEQIVLISRRWLHCAVLALRWRHPEVAHKEAMSFRKSKVPIPLSKLSPLPKSTAWLLQHLQRSFLWTRQLHGARAPVHTHAQTKQSSFKVWQIQKEKRFNRGTTHPAKIKKGELHPRTEMYSSGVHWSAGNCSVPRWSSPSFGKGGWVLQHRKPWSQDIFTQATNQTFEICFLVPRKSTPTIVDQHLCDTQLCMGSEDWTMLPAKEGFLCGQTICTET